MLTASAFWFLLQPLLVADAIPWLRWTVLGCCLGAATLVAFVWAVMRAPSSVSAALALDERFQLRERVTTSLTLDPVLAASPAGQALVADVNRRLDPVRVGDRFPVTLPWTACLVPAAATVLALLAVFYNPILPPPHVDAGDKLTDSKEVKDAIDKKLDKLKKKEQKPTDPKSKSPELAQLEAELDKLAHKPHDTKEEANELVGKMTELEDKIKKQEKELSDKAEGAQGSDEADRPPDEKASEGRPGQRSQEGPGSERHEEGRAGTRPLSRRLQAEEKVEKLKKNSRTRTCLREEREDATGPRQGERSAVDPEQKEKLADQLDAMKDQLERLARNRRRKSRS